MAKSSLIKPKNSISSKIANKLNPPQMSNKTDYIFFGSPHFARIILEKLIRNDLLPQAVICNPDRPTGRKKIITPPPVKELLTNLNLREKVKILQPEKLETNLVRGDIFIVAAYAKIIPKAVLDQARLGTIGVHPSLLPKHRGASPIQTALLENDSETGVSLYLMDDKMDHGPLLRQAKIPIAPDETYSTLEEKLANLAADLILETLPKFTSGEIKPQEQDHTQATFTKKLKTDDGFVDEKDLADAMAGDLTKAKVIDAKVRALELEPGTWTLKNGQRLKLIKSKIAGNKLVLEKIQFEGKKEQAVNNP